MHKAVGSMMATFLLLAGCAVSPVRPESGDQTERAVLAADAARFAAMTSGDFATLERLLAEDLVYTHANGLLQTREQMLATMRSGVMRYVTIAVDSARVSLHGDTAVVSGAVHFTAELNGTPLGFPARYLEVYVYREGRWQLLAWQSTRIPPAAN